MKPIVTLTLNSSVDVQWDVDEMVPVRKLRSSSPYSFPGGGGINVSRVIKTLHGQSIAVFTAGSLTGEFLRELVDLHGLLTRVVPIEEATRVSATAHERSTGHEFRITPPGPHLQESEWQSCLDAVFEFETDYIVATGSLPPGVPNDFYARVSRRAREQGTRVVLDTSGMALFEALKEGAFVVKPNLRELEHLVGRKAPEPEDQESLAREIVNQGKAEVVALTLGPDGALVVSKDDCIRMGSPSVDVKSTVGAGDTFVAALTLGLAQEWRLHDAVTLAVAASTATVMSAGTHLCQREDVERIYQEIRGEPLSL